MVLKVLEISKVILIKTILVLQQHIAKNGCKYFVSDNYRFFYVIFFRTRDTLAGLDDKANLIEIDERYARLGFIEYETNGEYDNIYDDGIVNVRDKDDTLTMN
jgi:hypothetical protein